VGLVYALQFVFEGVVLFSVLFYVNFYIDTCICPPIRLCGYFFLFGFVLCEYL